MFNKQREEEVMRLLKTHSIRIPLYKTPVGDLELKRNKDEDNYTFTLDSVDLDKEQQKELSKLWGIN